MSLFESIGRIVGEVVEAADETTQELAAGDLQGATGAVADGVQETGAAVEDGFNDAGEASSEATGGAVYFGTDNGVFNAGFVTQGGGARVVVDANASDGDVAAGTDVYRTENGVEVGATGSLTVDNTSATVDAAVYDDDGSERTESGVTASAGVHDDADGSWQAGVDTGWFTSDAVGRNEIGGTVNVDYERGSGWQAGVDSGVYEQRTDTGGETVRNEMGVTANVDYETSADAAQIGLDHGLFTEIAGDRNEVGATVNAGVSTDETGGFQVGADAGLYAEDEDSRAEIGATVNADLQDAGDRSGFQFGLDAGVMAERYGDTHVRGETGATANLGGSGFGDEGFQFGADAGLFAENDTDRVEGVVTANVDVEGDEDGFQAGVDAGVAGEHFGDTHTRGEAGVDAQVDVQTYEVDGVGRGFQAGLDAGLFGEYEGDRIEAGAQANVDVSGPTQAFGVDAGLYGEAIVGGSEAGRIESGATVNLDYESGPDEQSSGFGDFQFGLDVGVYSEAWMEGDKVLRGEAGATANTDYRPGEHSFDGGFFVDLDAPTAMTPDHLGQEGVRGEAGWSVGVDDDGNLDLGMFGEARHHPDVDLPTSFSDDGAARFEQGVTVGLNDDGVELGVYQEAPSIVDGAQGRGEAGIHVDPNHEGVEVDTYVELTRGDQEPARESDEVAEISLADTTARGALTVEETSNEPARIEVPDAVEPRFGDGVVEVVESSFISFPTEQPVADPHGAHPGRGRGVQRNRSDEGRGNDEGQRGIARSQGENEQAGEETPEPVVAFEPVVADVPDFVVIADLDLVAGIEPIPEIEAALETPPLGMPDDPMVITRHAPPEELEMPEMG